MVLNTGFVLDGWVHAVADGLAVLAIAIFCSSLSIRSFSIAGHRSSCASANRIDASALASLGCSLRTAPNRDSGHSCARLPRRNLTSESVSLTARAFPLRASDSYG